MKTLKGALKIFFELLLLGGLVFGLAAVINTFRGSSKGSLAYPPPDKSRPGVEKTVGAVYPPPGTSRPGLTLTPTTLSMDDISLTATAIAPKETPPGWVTLPPPKVLANPLGALATPFSLVTPAGDASGSITYLAREADGTVSTYSLDIDGTGSPKGNPRNLGKIGVSAMFVYPSPDGKQLILFTESGIIYLVNVETGKSVFLNDKVLSTVDKFLNWHPNSQYIVIGTGSGLILISLENGLNVHLVTTLDSGGSFDSAAISPDGMKVIASFSRSSDDQHTWMINLDGSDWSELFREEGRNFTWSPDGRKVAFCGNGGLTVMDADGSNRRNIGGNTTAGCFWPPVWSPDSRTLAAVDRKANNDFNAGLNGTPPEDTAIYLVNVETGDIQPLLPGSDQANLDPAWSPDGSQIAFVSYRSGTSEIWAVNVDGSDLRQLTHSGLAVRFPYWRRP